MTHEAPPSLVGKSSHRARTSLCTTCHPLPSIPQVCMFLPLPFTGDGCKATYDLVDTSPVFQACARSLTWRRVCSTMPVSSPQHEIDLEVNSCLSLRMRRCSMADRIGQQLGNYRLVALLGQGGFAEVYLGQHVRLTLQAAIKVLHTHLVGSEAEHFSQEAETIAKLTHPSIVRVFDFDVQEGAPFLVMDYAPNGSLRRCYPKGSVVPLPQILSSVKQVAAALQYAHEQKFIHRDVKPENMLIGQHQEVLLSDFGIATIAHSTSSLNVSAEGTSGTLAYMAPEQIEGHPRAASDQYALGIVVYEWLCGERPFEG